MKRSLSAILIALGAVATTSAQGALSTKSGIPADSLRQQVSAWKVSPLLGDRIISTLDTLHTNFAQERVPANVSDAFATTGNYASPGYNLIFMDREPLGSFFFTDALSAWLPSVDKMKFYNSRIPLTLLSYTTGGNKNTTQDRLRGEFSGNINPRAQIGALLDYPYSKGSYNYQAAKDFVWGFSGSYIGDRYEFQGFYNHYNSVNKENGGIKDDRYITNPAQVQGGSTMVDTKSIPTNLTAAHSRVIGAQLWMNNRYKLGFWDKTYHEEYEDSVISQRFVPVSAIIWTLQYNNNSHEFINTSTSEAADFWKNTYLSTKGTHDITRYSQLRNTVGIALMEGFNKWAAAGLTAFITHELQTYRQTPDTLGVDFTPPGLTLYPYPQRVAPRASENFVWAGAQLARRQGRILNYEATGELGILGRALGEVKLDGNLSTRFKLLGDSVTIAANGSFSNTAPHYLFEHYVSNHFVWENDFDMTRRYRMGGSLNVPHTGTRIEACVDNLDNLIYFGPDCLPVQHRGNVQVFSGRIHQNFAFRSLHWDNRVTVQSSTNSDVIPLPAVAVYSNLYLQVKIATLHLQLGIDCDYYTKYKAVNYQPATMTFYNQREVECGNYPWMNLYANMKLDKARFFVMMSHVNQGLTGNNYFSMPHYPLNPRRFQFGVSVDFAN